MSSVDVYLHGEHVGVLSHLSELGDASEFRLSADWRDRADRPVLGQIFEDEPHRVWKTTHRIPAWFSNLLPEGPLRRLLADQAGVHPERELHLLAALGPDLPGAVTVRARGALEETPVRPTRPAVRDDEPLSFSLAGLQLKFPVRFDARGPTLPVRGQGGRWIAKLPDPRFAHVPENEAACLTWARASGIDVPDFQLDDVREIRNLSPAIVETHTGRALLVQRFDRRDDGTTVHIEDFAQIRNVFPESKYDFANFETIGRVLRALCGEACLEQYVRRLVFMVLSGNADMHLKNWSVIYPDGRRPTLAPAYDLVSTLVFPSTSRRLALNLARTKDFRAIDLASFERLGRKVGVDPARVRVWAVDARDRIRDAWPTCRAEMPPEHAAQLEAHLAGLRM